MLRGYHKNDPILIVALREVYRDKWKARLVGLGSISNNDVGCLDTISDIVISDSYMMFPKHLCEQLDSMIRPIYSRLKRDEQINKILK